MLKKPTKITEREISIFPNFEHQQLGTLGAHDCKIILLTNTEKITFHCHKAILDYHSDLLRKMNSQIYLYGTEFTELHILCLLESIYTGMVADLMEDVQDINFLFKLRKVAFKWEIIELIKVLDVYLDYLEAEPRIIEF